MTATSGMWLSSTWSVTCPNRGGPYTWHTQWPQRLSMKTRTWDISLRTSWERLDDILDMLGQRNSIIKVNFFSFFLPSKAGCYKTVNVLGSQHSVSVTWGGSADRPPQGHLPGPQPHPGGLTLPVLVLAGTRHGTYIVLSDSGSGSSAHCSLCCPTGEITLVKLERGVVLGGPWL